MKIITDKEALKIIDKIYKIELKDYEILNNVKTIQSYINQQKDIKKNALYIINGIKNFKEQIDEIDLYNFDKCAMVNKIGRSDT